MKQPILLLALLSHLALATGYLLLTPAFEGPDENDHYRYAFHLANTGEAPVPRGTAQRVGRPLLDEVSMAIHPPLYYQLLAVTMAAADLRDVLPAPVVNPERGHPGQYMNFLHGSDEQAPVSVGIRLLRWLRGWSVLFGLFSIVLVHRLGRLACPDRPAVADVAAVVLACLPMWSFMHGVINAGNLSVLWCQATLVAFAGVLTRRHVTIRDGLVIGALLGAALVTKLTGLFLLVIWALVAVWLHQRREQPPRQVIVFCMISSGLAAAIAGPYFVHNYLEFGDPFLLSAHSSTFADAAVPEGKTWRWLVDGFFPQIFSSLLGQFGWFALPPRPWLVWTGGGVALLSLVGLLRAMRRGNGPGLFVFLGGTSMLVFALTLHFNLDFRQPQGRLLFPAIGPMAVLFAAGLVSLFPPHRLWNTLFFVPPLLGFAVLAWHFKPAFVPASAPAPAAQVTLVSGITRTPESPRIRLEQPTGNPPVLRWQELAAPRGAVYTIYVFDDDGRVWGATYEWTPPPKLELTGPTFQMPADWWQLFPKDRDYLFKVRRLPDRSAGVWPPNLPESNVVRVRR